MARLILEEDGATRRFKLSQGKLTFGSGDKATLKLASDEVAALHGQIDMGDDGAVVRVAKGVQPVKVGGRPVQGAHVMKAGEAVMVGTAKLTIEYDDGEGPAAPVQKPVAARSGGAAGRSGSGRSAGRSSGGASGRVERSRPRAKSSGIPGWLIALLVVGGIGGVGYAIIGNTAKNMAGDVFNYDVKFSQAERMRPEDPIQARDMFLLMREEELTPAQRKEVNAQLDLLGDQLANIDDSARNAEITQWLTSRVINYFDTFPVKDSRPHARLFVKRASWFLREYPTHDQVSKVERLLRRATPVAELDQPATVEDLRVEVKGLTDKRPMDFPEGFAAIKKFIAETSDVGAQATALEIKEETRRAEKAFYEGQLDKAAIVYDKATYPDKYNPGQAAEDMVAVIVAVEDEALKKDAARRIAAISEVNAAFLRGYKRQRPDAWAKMIAVPELLELAQRLGVEE